MITYEIPGLNPLECRHCRSTLLRLNDMSLFCPSCGVTSGKQTSGVDDSVTETVVETVVETKEVSVALASRVPKFHWIKFDDTNRIHFLIRDTDGKLLYKVTSGNYGWDFSRHAKNAESQGTYEKLEDAKRAVEKVFLTDSENWALQKQHNEVNKEVK